MNGPILRGPTRSPASGFTLIEMLVVVAIIAVLVGLLLPALRQAKRQSQSLEDKSQMRQIHQTMLVFAGDNDGVLPIPGLINRLADPYTGQQLSGAGPEDYEKNTSANMYSALLAREYFTEELLVSPVEVNPRIPFLADRAYRYDYTAYQPINDIYWDGDWASGGIPATGRFQANIEDGESHTSYYHQALCGRRKNTKWRNTATQHDPALSTRAPYQGQLNAGDQAEFDRSYTLLLHGSESAWSGNVVFGDNHSEIVDTFYPTGVTYLMTGQSLAKDNIFDQEFSDPTPGHAGDSFLTMTMEAAEFSVVEYHEELRP